VAAPKKGRRPSGAQGRPGRALALILIAMVALTGGMFLSGHTTPRLGIDLAGGTSITLTAKNEPGQKNAINKTNMNTAVGIIERRVNGLGVSEAEVQTQGDRNIIVNIPRGTNEKQAREQVGTTAQLFFRPVLVAGAPTATPEPSPSASQSGKQKAEGTKDTGKSTASPSASPTTQGRAVTEGLKAGSSPSPKATDSKAAKPTGTPAPNPSPGANIPAALQHKFQKLDCSTRQARAKAAEGGKPTEPIVACDQKGREKYILGPRELDGTQLDKAQAVFDQQSGKGWIVQLSFNSEGAKKFAGITGRIATQQPNRFAIVLDDQVVSAPSVSSAIPGGNAEISGSFTQQSATELANVLSYGALPLSFDA
jgi:preprotein translocase subunit SecD